MILTAQDHRDLLEALDTAYYDDGVDRAQLERWKNLEARLRAHPIATTAVIQACPTAREVRYGPLSSEVERALIRRQAEAGQFDFTTKLLRNYTRPRTAT